MSDCFLCCSFKAWLRLILFSLFLVKSWRRLCSGWYGILFTFSPYVSSLAFLRESKGSTAAVFCMVAMGLLFIAPGYETHVLYLVEFVRVGLGCCSPHTSSGFERWSHCLSVHWLFSLAQYVVSMIGVNLVWLLRCPSTFTRADLSWRMQRIHVYIRPDTPAWSTLRSKPSLHQKRRFNPTHCFKWHIFLQLQRCIHRPDYLRYLI